MILLVSRSEKYEKYFFNLIFFTLVLKYEELVLPEEITIFETYNPGAVIKIWAYTIVKQWICLWEQPSVRCPKFPRMFSPKLKKINVPTK